MSALGQKRTWGQALFKNLIGAGKDRCDKLGAVRAIAESDVGSTRGNGITPRRHSGQKSTTAHKGRQKSAAEGTESVRLRSVVSVRVCRRRHQYSHSFPPAPSWKLGDIRNGSVSSYWRRPRYYRCPSQVCSQWRPLQPGSPDRFYGHYQWQLHRRLYGFPAQLRGGSQPAENAAGHVHGDLSRI